ncbi:hypothetical protein [Marinobacterium aestuariivivens]|uniref:DUF1902 domain-containing protein n=1 Tax=Marinobacterium aestuariivivens TaxID=1698799 RepID=A0ABW1ZYD5_9GAMM
MKSLTVLEILDDRTGLQFHVALDDDGTPYWIGHIGHGIEDAVPMQAAHASEALALIEAGTLVPDGPRYVPAAALVLTLYRRPSQ